MTSSRFVALGYCLGTLGPGLALMLDGGPAWGRTWTALSAGLIDAGLMLVVLAAVEVVVLLRARQLDREPDA